MIDFYRRLLAAMTNANGPAYRHYDERRDWNDMTRAMRRVNSVLADGRERVVALYAGKSFAAYAGLFATLLSDNCWVPINPDLPPGRNLQMLALARPSIILADRDLPPDLAAFAASEGVAVHRLDRLAADGAEREFDLSRGFRPEAIAYVMFTSGSTGVPKGVPMTHANYIPFIETAMKILPFGPGEVFADYHDFGFDISIFYLFCCPLTGGAFAPAIAERDRTMPLGNLVANEVTVLATVPSTIARIRTLKRDARLETRLKILFLCGEPLRLDILRYCQDRIGAPNIYNFYGLTETGVENFHHRCAPDDPERYADQGYAPIGLPLPGNPILLGDDAELSLGGVQVTPGYLGGIGAERFFVQDGLRWFKSGDKVIQAHGVYFCKGRLDNQVKVNGYRIELMDIEAHLRRLDGVEEAVCFVETVGERAFIVAALHGSAPPDVHGIRPPLKGLLPPYMIPSSVFRLEDVPVNKAGKVDRLAVRALYPRTAT